MTARYNFVDMAGQHFNRSRVLGRAANNGNGNACWRLVCNCGNRFVLRGIRIRQIISQGKPERIACKPRCGGVGLVR